MMKKGSVLITGATDGIGTALSEELALHYEKIIVHGKDWIKGKSVVDDIKRKTGNKNVYGAIFDLRDIHEITEGANNMSHTFKDIKVIINNAGIFNKEQIICKNGIEEMLMVNHFSHFVLTKLLLDKGNTEISHIINTSSLAHLHVKFDENSIYEIKKFNPHKVYGASKLYCLLHARKLSGQLKDRGIHVNCYDPGFIDTKLTRSGWDSPPESNIKNAVNTVVSILNKEYPSGEYIGNLQAIESSKYSRDDYNIKALWNCDKELYERLKPC